ncbi:conserved hypothetical protein [Methanocaldococcus infernus ME]|uniref:Uncharacterized protein n=1 Tax=Methanocaldococcus infernus (strain DSM 11812 / JCM 15783 / ME) TaxID=573063 RepID=D5VTR8_METIM|nr:conserved hypothetical protein [Methanocaldococcus infernus ME]
MNNNKKTYRKLYWHIWYILFGILLILMFNLEPPYKTWIIGLLVIMALSRIIILWIDIDK